MKFIPYLLLLMTSLFTSCKLSEYDDIPPCTVCEECPSIRPTWSSHHIRIDNFPAIIDTISRTSDESKSWDQSVMYVNSQQDRRFFLAIDAKKLPTDSDWWGLAGVYTDRPKYPWHQGHDEIMVCVRYSDPDTTICGYPLIKCHPFQDYVSTLNLKDSDVGKSIILNGYLYVYYLGNYFMKENPSDPCDVKSKRSTGVAKTITYFVPLPP